LSGDSPVVVDDALPGVPMMADETRRMSDNGILRTRRKKE
jgi:hypothetical protein